ncbi:hypothetical protein N0V93_002506 [Gnomoniopsis smithogilvyi]|uniref:Uncharacterized protein n=1 Tax=Gnomoniopsis smithogilvyi TaxID=1191159 RepID=A0A9W9CZ48_9PEZI|nr:hypothetical protein N0V93_002506 [Gnomoniopsis smithogilvyi]
MAHSLSKPCLDRLTIYQILGLLVPQGDSTPETANIDTSSDGLETAHPPFDSCEATPEVSGKQDYFEHLLDKIWEDCAVGKPNEEDLVELRQLDLRERLHGHWTDDRNRRCDNCHGRKRYVHGVFRNTNPFHETQTISLEEVRSEASPLNKSIWGDFENLRAIIQRFEAVIQKRWAKKSIIKRKLALQSAWAATSDPAPQPMAKIHNPGVDYLRRRCNESKQICHCGVADDEKRHLFLWPTMNLEDLTKFEPLLLLLNARGRHSPPTFAFADLQTVHFGVRVEQMSHPRYLDMYNMVFTGQEGPEAYGKLVSWEEDPKAYQRLHYGRDTSPGEGLWILEIQQRLYRFLVNICQVILHDQQIEDSDRLLAQPVAPEPTLPTANGHEQDTSSSLMVTRYESAYHVPAKLDIRRLQNLVESKLAEAEDTLWALREDPSFFATTLEEMYQSRPEHIRDSANRLHPAVVSGDAHNEFMAHVVSMVWCQYVSAVERWGFLYHKVAHLADLKERLFDNAQVPIRPEDDLPPELSMAICSLLFHFHSLLEGRLKHVVARAQWSPPLRHLYRRCLGSGSDQHQGQFLSEGVHLKRSRATQPPEVDEYLWVLRHLSNPDARKCLGIHNGIEYLERIASDRAENKIVSKMQAADLSEYTIVSECVRQLEMFHPWAATFEARMAENKIAQELRAEYKETVSKQNPLACWRPSKSALDLGAKLANIHYPVDKAPSKGSIDAICKAERSLDDFWRAAMLEFQDSELITERLYKVLQQTKPERTPIWAEPRKTETRVTVGLDNGLIALPFDGKALYVQGHPTKVKPAEPRVKVKSRGIARTSTAQPETTKPTQDPKPPITAPSIDVDQRALKVVEMLFYKHSPGTSKGEISWTEFTYMMHAVGFSVEKLGGSSWQFTPVGSDLIERGYRGIQFHEPHPKAKLALVVARRYGRRLTRTYGWCAEMFRLRTG